MPPGGQRRKRQLSFDISPVVRFYWVLHNKVTHEPPHPVPLGGSEVRLLMTQPGVGPVTALAFVLTIGDVRRFSRSKQISSYLGLIPRECSSGGKQRMGSISKQGIRLLRTLLVEAAQSAVRFDPEFRKEYQHRCHQKPRAVAKVAAARKLAVRLFWMLRTQWPYPSVFASRGA
jgi:transposase